eukprot:TRINITY_DN30258_c0_g1_i1.p1 TRINITY_DN30258_c0_g1~~TRINITY_DN30258_c0_g1_i1.p1  ORF type:complete len:129 (+),score=14.47 TRINITY_DN30258_c0_g1_i1:61-447(+)
MQPALQPAGATALPQPLMRSWSSPGINASMYMLQGPGSHDPTVRLSCGLGESRFKGRPWRDPQRAAGQPSGGPLKRDYLTKFSSSPARGIRRDPNALSGHKLVRTDWQTMKYDMKKNAHNDIPRPHAV